MPKIIAHASNRHGAKYIVQVGGRAYQAQLRDLPGEDCVVHIEDVEDGSDLHRLVKAAVLKDWLGIDAVR
jgi:hypothetical protein